QAVSKALQKVRLILARREVVRGCDARVPAFQPEDMLVRLVTAMEKQGRTVTAVVSSRDDAAPQEVLYHRTRVSPVAALTPPR
ncbi:MAG TPA: hypothetical protein VF292_08205, partial [Rhodanobacteraceae bacterium]